MGHLVLGTAGHIDHGKSALVLALTGTDPDRLKEEKRRGITIELGFADLELDPERVLSFVDVPGHERFVRHMVAGAAGIDAVLLVVAADQGVQPQTREHLDICALLGVRRGVIALTKCDLVEDDLLEVVSLEVSDLVVGSFLEGAPVLPVSAKRGTGLEPLKQALSELFEALPPRPVEGVPRLAVDRSFVLKGFGTVVTGTLVSGKLEEGQEVEILPGGRRARIRGLQVHRHKRSVAEAGQRTAINLQGVDCDEVPRGSTISTPGALVTTRRAWARVSLLPDAPEQLARGGPVRFHQATCDRPARVRVLGKDDDGDLRVELHLGEQTVLAPGDAFILRRPAPVDTVGGGVIVDARPPRPKQAVHEGFRTDFAEPSTAVKLRLGRSGLAGCDPSRLASELGLTPGQLAVVLEAMEQVGEAARYGPLWFDRDVLDEAARRATAAVAAHHLEQPLQPGISREVLRGRTCAKLPQEAWRDLLAELRDQGQLRLDGEVVARVDHRVVLDESDERLARNITDRFRAAGLEAPEIDQVVPAGERGRATAIVDLLIARGELVRIDTRRMLHAEAVERLRALLRDYARDSRTIDVAAFKQLIGVTRKHAIPLLEYLDGERATRRVGNRREILL